MRYSRYTRTQGLSGGLAFEHTRTQGLSGGLAFEHTHTQGLGDSPPRSPNEPLMSPSSNEPPMSPSSNEPPMSLNAPPSLSQYTHMHRNAPVY